ncbi:MAG: protein kinase, partial [Cyanobacteria bacterium P01_H01_bin.130]
MIGQLLDKRYRILQVLGGGAFGKTYLAADLRRPGYPQCVVKQLRLLRPNPTAIKNSHRLFQREAEMLEKLGTHGQIPRLLAYFEEGKQFYLVKEFTPGHPLSKEMPTGEPLPEHRVIGILIEILEVLTFVHGQNVIHRDLKPANLIRRNSDGKLVLIDFGSVKEIIQQEGGEEEAAARTIAAGTPAYMPVEQFYGHPRLNSDLYAVGMIAIQALGGLSSEQLQQLRGDRGGEVGKLEWREMVSVTPGLAGIVDRMIHHSHSQRYQSAEDILADLYEFANIPIEETAMLSGGLSGSLSGGLSAGMSFRQGLSTQQQPAMVSPLEKTLRSRWFPWAVGLGGVALVGLSWFLELPQGAMAAYYRGQGEAVLEPIRPQLFLQPLSAARLNQMSRQLAADRGMLDDQATEYSQAVEDYTKALSWSVTGRGFFQRGTVHFARREWRAAVTDLNRALQADYREPAVHLYLGLVQRMLGDRDSALNSFDQAVALSPSFSAAYLGRGILQLERGEQDAAVTDFQQTLEQQPNWAAAYR